MRGQQGDYDDWGGHGNPRVGLEGRTSYFIRHGTDHRLDGGGQDPLHGHGVVAGREIRVKWEILEAFRDGSPGGYSQDRGLQPGQ
jgi:hypothetical protein